MEISSSIFLYCATLVCIITVISSITDRGSARPWGFAKHRMMYRKHLNRSSESVFGAPKFEFCPNKGKESGSRIAYRSYRGEKNVTAGICINRGTYGGLDLEHFENVLGRKRP